jgi:hypothetical protein
MPYMQYDLGPNPPNVTSVRITARADCCLYQSQNLYVYLSDNSTDFRTGNTLCAGNVTFGGIGNTLVLLCPVAVAGKRYLTVQMNTTENVGGQYLSLQEVTAIYDGACEGITCLLLPCFVFPGAVFAMLAMLVFVAYTWPLLHACTLL